MKITSLYVDCCIKKIRQYDEDAQHIHQIIVWLATLNKISPLREKKRGY